MQETGQSGFSGENVPASQAQFFAPRFLAFNPSGSLLISDTLNHRIRRVDQNGIVTTITGTGVASFSGDGGPAVNGTMSSPTGIAVDAAGNIFVATTVRIRRISPSGVITTIAGKASWTFSAKASWPPMPR